MICLLLGAIAFAQTGAATMAAGNGNAAPASTGIRTPLVLGGFLGFGSGTGVGAERGLGLYQVEPILGLWYPRLGFLRVGYGFYDYNSRTEDTKYEVEHSDLDIKLGVHLLGELYVTGTYSRVNELSDVGDIAWNEWGLGGGSLLNLFSKTLLFAEVGYHWVLKHYDPFQKKSIKGGRIQMNIGFAAYVY
ncbi:hypothetical protein [Fibrobacter sp. UWR1]|uniref:hypothetical protein n=1 Tax=Fibrobacter sp. UWR1 TaxID=2135645 RepID=UPI000D6BCE0B|nr:hypothetical protein [Fibrobacter sp. UWR1]